MSDRVLVHKAVEPDNLTRKGKARLQAMIEAGEWVAQPKLDGVYAQVVNVPGEGWLSFSRTGELLRSVPQHILDSIAAQKLAPDFRVIGDLWKPHTDHSTINGMARKQRPQDGLEFHLFDMVGGGLWSEDYASRYAWLESMPWGRGIEVVRDLKVDNRPGWGVEETLDYLYELARKIKAKPSAYDGLVLKDTAGLFVPGSGKDGGAIKIKPRSSGDFRVVGTTKGIGNREGGIGALVVDLGDGKTCEVGTGLTMADVFDRGADYFVGKIVEVEYLDLTKDGLLREPAYKSVRFDKDKPDTLHK